MPLIMAAKVKSRLTLFTNKDLSESTTYKGRLNDQKILFLQIQNCFRQTELQKENTITTARRVNM